MCRQYTLFDMCANPVIAPEPNLSNPGIFSYINDVCVAMPVLAREFCTGRPSKYESLLMENYASAEGVCSMAKGITIPTPSNIGDSESKSLFRLFKDLGKGSM